MLFICVLHIDFTTLNVLSTTERPIPSLNIHDNEILFYVSDRVFFYYNYYYCSTLNHIDLTNSKLLLVCDVSDHNL